jgi:hypothetical protein
MNSFYKKYLKYKRKYLKIKKQVGGMRNQIVKVIDKEITISFPDTYFCQVTEELFVDPVITVDGITIERKAIEEWFQNHNTSPVTGAVINKLLIPNHALRNSIEDIKQDAYNKLLQQQMATVPSSGMAVVPSSGMAATPAKSLLANAFKSIDEEGIRTSLQQRGFEPSEQLVESLIGFSTLEADIFGVFLFVPPLMSQFGYEQSRAFQIAIALYNQGYANLQSLRDTFNDPEFHDASKTDLDLVLKELLTSEEIHQIMAYAEGRSN